jgi:hypothetical protein
MPIVPSTWHMSSSSIQLLATTRHACSLQKPSSQPRSNTRSICRHDIFCPRSRQSTTNHDQVMAGTMTGWHCPLLNRKQGQWAIGLCCIAGIGNVCRCPNTTPVENWASNGKTLDRILNADGTTGVTRGELRSFAEKCLCSHHRLVFGQHELQDIVEQWAEGLYESGVTVDGMANSMWPRTVQERGEAHRTLTELDEGYQELSAQDAEKQEIIDHLLDTVGTPKQTLSVVREIRRKERIRQAVAQDLKEREVERLEREVERLKRRTNEFARKSCSPEPTPCGICKEPWAPGQETSTCQECFCVYHRTCMQCWTAADVQTPAKCPTCTERTHFEEGQLGSSGKRVQRRRLSTGALGSFRRLASA